MSKYKYNSKLYQNWRKKVFRRDRFKCQLCGDGGSINAHHIKRKVDFPELAHITQNGITLCEICHRIVTGHEKMFELLFTIMNLNKLTLQTVYTFFGNLSSHHKSIVKEFERAEKWLLIPYTLANRIKKQIFNNKRIPNARTCSTLRSV